MKIAIITSGFLPVIDGVTVSGFFRVQKLSQWGHRVLLLCPDYSALADVYPNWKDYTGNILPGVKVVNLPSTPFMDLDFERNVSFRAYQTVLEALEAFEPDIIHVDEPERLFVGFWRVPGVDYAKRKGIPCVSFFRTNFLEYAEDYLPFSSGIIAILKWLFIRLLRFVYNSYDATLVSSRVTQAKIVKLGIENTLSDNLLGVDLLKFNPNLRQAGFFEQKYNLPEFDRRVKLVFVGRLTPDKGWDFTLDAFAELGQNLDLDRLAIIIAGDGPLRDEITTRLGRLTPYVRLFGRIPPREVASLLANSDLHVTASEKETKGLTVLEAFAAGIPVIAPRAGGVTDSIKDGWNGFLFAPQDRQDFFAKLKHLVDRPALRQEMGARNREYMSQYSWDRTVQNLVHIWEAKIARQSQDYSQTFATTGEII